MKKSSIAQSFLLRVICQTADFNVPDVAHVRLEPVNAQWMLQWIERAKELAKIDHSVHYISLLGYIVKEYAFNVDLPVEDEAVMTLDELSEEHQAAFKNAIKEYDELEAPEIRFHPDGVTWVGFLGDKNHVVETEKLRADVIEGFLAHVTDGVR